LRKGGTEKEGRNGVVTEHRLDTGDREKCPALERIGDWRKVKTKVRREKANTSRARGKALQKILLWGHHQKKKKRQVIQSPARAVDQGNGP